MTLSTTYTIHLPTKQPFIHCRRRVAHLHLSDRPAGRGARHDCHNEAHKRNNGEDYVQRLCHTHFDCSCSVGKVDLRTQEKSDQNVLLFRVLF